MSIWKKRDEIVKTFRRTLILELGGKCAYCGSEDRLELDHIIPLCTNGQDIPKSKRIAHWLNEVAKNNLQVLCHECNEAKGTKRPEHPF